MIPHAFAIGVLNTVINSAITWAVPPQEMGDALGTSSALESLSRKVYYGKNFGGNCHDGPIYTFEHFTTT
jgi:hypothetical protein